MNILAQRINICQEAFMEAAWMLFLRRAQLTANLGQCWEPEQGKPTPEPFLCHIGARQRSRTVGSNQPPSSLRAGQTLVPRQPACHAR